MTSQIMWCLSVLLVFLNLGFTFSLNLDFDSENLSPQNISATFNSHTVLNCSLNFPQGNEIPYYVEWKKDNKLIFTWQEGKEQTFDDFADRIVRFNSTQRSYGRGSINITAIRETDSGMYECKVFFPNRSPISRNNGTWFNLTIDGPILISIPPVNQTTLEKEPAFFSCIIKDGNVSVNWFKDNIPIANLSQLAVRSWIHQNGSLTINSTAMDDVGEYTCEVVDSTGYTQKASAFLDVQYKAKIIYTKERIYFPYGGSAILDCHFRSNPPLISLQWYKDGFLYVPSNVAGVYSKPNGSLYFEKVDENHAGNYSCTPTNKLGFEGSSRNMHVIVQRPPSFITMPKGTYFKKLGETIEIPCETSNTDGQSTIIWIKKDGSALPEDRSLVHNGSLTLNNLKEEDVGIYECKATNEAATVTTYTELMIENVPPRAPYNLVATSTDTSVTLEWTPFTTSMRPFTEYEVFYKLADAAEWKTIKSSSSRTTKATISNLMPGQEYKFMVLSQDKYSDGMFSKTIVVWTKGGDDNISVPLREPLGDNSHNQMGPPRNLSVTLTTDGYHLSWTPPNHGVDFLGKYLVRWSQGTNIEITKTAETEKNYYLIKDLDEDEIYHFQVYSLSKNGVMVSSDKISVHVPAYGRIRAAVAGVGCILLIILIGAIVWYSRHKLMAAKESMKKANAEN